MGAYLFILYGDTYNGIMYNNSEVIKMLTEAEKKAVAKYHAKLDEIKVRVPKGKREVYKAHAERQGKSLNALIIELLEKDMQEH
jgi:predicted HicB family RNase H-like nuclease